MSYNSYSRKIKIIINTNVFRSCIMQIGIGGNKMNTYKQQLNMVQYA